MCVLIFAFPFRSGYKPIIAVGCVAMGLSLLASAFTFQSLPAIFITQGACVGISQGKLILFLTDRGENFHSD